MDEICTMKVMIFFSFSFSFAPVVFKVGVKHHHGVHEYHYYLFIYSFIYLFFRVVEITIINVIIKKSYFFKHLLPDNTMFSNLFKSEDVD